jgi:hypothetical protein
VSQKAGIRPDDKLTLADLEKIIPAMVQMETGKKLMPGDMWLSKNLDKLPFFGAALFLLLFKKFH